MTQWWQDVWARIENSEAVVLGVMGGLGGLTAGLAASNRRAREVIRQVVIGAAAAIGIGGSGGAVVVHWLGLPPEVIALFGAGGGASYLAGVFVPAIVEVMLSRIRAGRLPTDRGGGDA